MDFADITVYVILGLVAGLSLLMVCTLVISCIKDMINDYKDDKERRKNDRWYYWRNSETGRY